jgi:hypothetical protein
VTGERQEKGRKKILLQVYYLIIYRVSQIADVCGSTDIVMYVEIRLDIPYKP